MNRSERRAAAEAYNLCFDPALHHKQGVYACPKGTVSCDTSLLYMLCHRLDGDQRIRWFSASKITFEYCHERQIKQGRFSLDVWTKDGRRKLLYATSQRLLHTPEEEAKIEAAEAAAPDHDAAFELWTEVELYGPSPDYMRSVIPYIMDKLYLNEPVE